MDDEAIEDDEIIHIVTDATTSGSTFMSPKVLRHGKKINSEESDNKVTEKIQQLMQGSTLAAE